MLVGLIKDVGNVFDPENDLVSGLKEEFALHLVLHDASRVVEHVETVLGEAGDLVSGDGTLVQVERKELLGRSVLALLHGSLERGFSASVEQVHEVSGRDVYAVLSLCFVESLVDASPVILVHAAVLHELNPAALDDRTALGAVVHDGHLHSGRLVPDGDRRLNRVVVRSDVAPSIGESQVPRGTVVKDALLHLEAVGVSIELSFVVDVRRVEIDRDLKADVRVERDAEQLDFCLDHAKLVQLDSDNTVALVVGPEHTVIESHNELALGVRLPCFNTDGVRVNLRVVVIVFGSKDVSPRGLIVVLA